MRRGFYHDEPDYTCPQIDSAIDMLEDLRKSSDEVRQWARRKADELEGAQEEISALETKVSELEDEVETLKDRIKELEEQNA